MQIEVHYVWPAQFLIDCAGHRWDRRAHRCGTCWRRPRGRLFTPAQGLARLSAGSLAPPDVRCGPHMSGIDDIGIGPGYFWWALRMHFRNVPPRPGAADPICNKAEKPFAARSGFVPCLQR